MPPTPRLLLKRIALWMTGSVLFLAWYVLSAPFAEFAVKRYAPPVVESALRTFYLPLIYLDRYSDVPGHDAFHTYLVGCQEMLKRIP